MKKFQTFFKHKTKPINSPTFDFSYQNDINSSSFDSTCECGYVLRVKGMTNTKHLHKPLTFTIGKYSLALDKIHWFQEDVFVSYICIFVFVSKLKYRDNEVKTLNLTII